MNNYPIMSKSEEEKAPFNEPLDKTVEREVSISLSFTANSKVPKDATEEEIKTVISGDVIYYINNKIKEFKDIVIDEIEVIDE